MTIRIGCLVLAALIGTPGTAWAGDDGETIEQANDTIADIAKGRKKKDEDLIQSSFVRVVELHNGLEGDGMRKKLQAAVGSVLKDKKCASSHSSAVSTLEQLDDGDGVLKQLKPLLPKDKLVKASDLQVYAVTVVGTVNSVKGIALLSGLASKAKDVRVRAAAVDGLGKYRPLEKKRVKVFRILMNLLRTTQPKPDKPLDALGKKVWGALEKPLVAALNELTYKDLKSAAAWTKWEAANKGGDKAAFAD